MKKRNQLTKQLARKTRVRKRIPKTSDRPRLHVHRTNQHLYVQIIDDVAAQTLVAASDHELKDKKATKAEKATQVGELIASKAKQAKITKVSFDRGSYKYHGRVKALADSARAKGLDF